jgi:putative mycofactocin binding protein MftB
VSALAGGRATPIAAKGRAAPVAADERAASARTEVRPDIDPASGWRLHPQVAVRPEPFGALLYHFGTRKLSFLKNRTIAAVVESLSSHTDVRSALRANGIGESQERSYLQALEQLAASQMVVPEDIQEASE